MNITEFEKLWALQPQEYGKVFVWDKERKIHFEKTIFRKYLSYIRIPEFKLSVPKSYMYNGLETSVPNGLIHYLQKAWERDTRYNAMQVNWYQPHDYIEPHSDCDYHLVEDYKILIMSFDEPGAEPRIITFEPREDRMTRFADEVEYLAMHNPLCEINRFLNRYFRHRVDPGEGRRISITFRMLKENT